ncbi:stage III sporulation protein AF [Microbacteriaceae bacterium 4G12]
MQFLTEWVRNIIIFLLLASVLHMILPNSGLQKYVKFVVSLLLVVLILTPLFQLLQVDIHKVIASFDGQKYTENGKVENLIDAKKKEIQASQRAYILEQMAVQMKKQVAKELEERYGVQVVNMHVAALQDKQQIKSQQDIQGVTVVVAKAEPKRSEAVATIKSVEINTNVPYESSLDNQIPKDVQQFLSQEWQLEQAKIKVEMEGGTKRANEGQQN